MDDDALTAAIREVRERARARHPQGSLGLDGVAAPDLLPLVHARDAAEAKVAAIGTVNPRPPGLKNSIVQRVKKLIARSLDWHIREQVEFNRAAMGCVQASIEAFSEMNRALAAFALQARELKDAAADLKQWQAGVEERRAASEIHMLRTISELQAGFQHRVTLLEQSFREMVRDQHSNFEAALDKNTNDVQKRLWRDLEQIRGEYEKLIHRELKLIRQKAVAQHATEEIAPPRATEAKPIAVDWLRFAEDFRGSQEEIRERQKPHIARFAGASGVLDVGCGRGEFLEAARDAGIDARGIDQSEECVGLCLAKGLKAERADLFEYLEALPDASLGGLFCSQVVEHLPPERLPDFIQLLARKMNRGALVCIETPNPECLAIFATHFYLDPTHTRPVPSRLLGFYLEEAGFVNLEVAWLSPAVESMPELAELPEAVREKFFGALDYAIYAKCG